MDGLWEVQKYSYTSGRLPLTRTRFRVEHYKTIYSHGNVRYKPSEGQTLGRSVLNSLTRKETE